MIDNDILHLFLESVQDIYCNLADNKHKSLFYRIKNAQTPLLNDIFHMIDYPISKKYGIKCQFCDNNDPRYLGNKNNYFIHIFSKIKNIFFKQHK